MFAPRRERWHSTDGTRWRAGAGHPTHSTSRLDTRTRPSPALLLACARHRPRPRRPDPRTPPRAEAPHRATPRSSAPRSFPTSHRGTTTLLRRARSHRRPPPPHRRATPRSSARRSSARMEWRARTRPTPRTVTARALAAAGGPPRPTAAGSPPTALQSSPLHPAATCRCRARARCPWANTTLRPPLPPLRPSLAARAATPLR